MQKTIETDRLILREWRESDLEPFARMNADPMVMEHMPRMLSPKDTGKLIQRFEAQIKEYGYGMFAVERKEDRAFVGTVGLNTVDFKAHFTPVVEIAWRLDYGFWGQGYATEASRAVMAFGFERIDLKEIVSFTVYDNGASIHVMEKLGMVRDEKGDFDYPKLPKGHPMGRFVLYRMSKKQYVAQKGST